MALRLVEGFETFGATVGNLVGTGLNRRYSSFYGLSLSNYASSMQLAAGRNGGYSVKGCNSNYQYFYHVVAADDVPTNDTWIIGVAVRFDSSYPDENAVVVLGHSSASTSYWNFALKLLDTGQVAAYGAGNVHLATTTDPVFARNQWHYFEVKVVCHDTAGSYEVRVDGITVLADSNVDTRTGADTRFVRFRCDEFNQYLDDIYICDTDGTTNNDFLGQVVVEAIFPNADGDSSDWMPASGTDNYAMLDDNPTDDDTSYVESNTEGETDLYQYTDLSTITDEDILGVVLKTEPRMTAFPGDLDLYQTVKSGTTTSDGDPANVATDSYTSVQRVLETNPDTSSAWTASGVNGAQFGIKTGT